MQVFHNPEFRNMFSSYLGSDTYEDESKQNLLALADVVVLYSLQRRVSANEIVEALEYALNNWGSDVIDEFEEVSNTFWRASVHDEEILRSVVERMLVAARLEDSTLG